MATWLSPLPPGEAEKVPVRVVGLWGQEESKAAFKSMFREPKTRQWVALLSKARPPAPRRTSFPLANRWILVTALSIRSCAC